MEVGDNVDKNDPFIYFCKLPGDLKYLLINVYMNPYTSMAFLRVCKEFNNRYNPRIKRDFIIKRFLKKKSYDEHCKATKEASLCEKCFQLFTCKRSYMSHMSKHRQFEMKGKKWPQIHSKPTSCQECDAPYASHLRHKCLLVTKMCRSSHIKAFYPWVEHICDKKGGEMYEIELSLHVCHFRCRECKSEPLHDYDDGIGDNSITEHFKICTAKMNMVSKYGIRKSKTIMQGDGEYEIFVCYYCDKLKHEHEGMMGYEEMCTCICKECNSIGANKVITDNATIYFICRDCAKCTKCGAKWKESSLERTWHYEKEPICADCSKLSS